MSALDGSGGVEAAADRLRPSAKVALRRRPRATSGVHASSTLEALKPSPQIAPLLVPVELKTSTSTRRRQPDGEASGHKLWKAATIRRPNHRRRSAWRAGIRQVPSLTLHRNVGAISRSTTTKTAPFALQNAICSWYAASSNSGSRLTKAVLREEYMVNTHARKTRMMTI